MNSQPARQAAPEKEQRRKNRDDAIRLRRPYAPNGTLAAFNAAVMEQAKSEVFAAAARAERGAEMMEAFKESMADTAYRLVRQRA